MENKIYDVQFFINKFQQIPERLWFVGNFEDGDGVKKCALGHCKFNQEQLALHGLFPDPDITPGSLVARINDGMHPRYPQPTPKQRILAALYDIRAKQQPEPKEKVVYVTVDEKVRELQREVNTHQS